MKQLIDTELEVVAFAILAIVILEAIALFKGIDGIMFGAAMAGIGTLIGWVAKMFQTKNKK